MTCTYSITRHHTHTHAASGVSSERKRPTTTAATTTTSTTREGNANPKWQNQIHFQWNIATAFSYKDLWRVCDVRRRDRESETETKKMMREKKNANGKMYELSTYQKRYKFWLNGAKTTNSSSSRRFEARAKMTHTHTHTKGRSRKMENKNCII